jgi:formiminoglutamase
MHDGILNSYTIHGLHKAYVSQSSLEDLKQKGVVFTCFEDYILGEKSLYDDAKALRKIHEMEPYGIEMDMDAIAMMPSSAYSPSGWTVNDARMWLRVLSRDKYPAYLNLTEGACDLNTWSDLILGKTLAYLVYDLLSSSK